MFNAFRSSFYITFESPRTTTTSQSAEAPAPRAPAAAAQQPPPADKPQAPPPEQQAPTPDLAARVDNYVEQLLGSEPAVELADVLVEEPPDVITGTVDKIVARVSALGPCSS